MKQLAVGANFKRAAAGRNEREGFDPFTEFKDLGRQTDGLGRVISNHAVFDRDFSLHVALLSRKNGRKLDRGGQVWYNAGAGNERPARAVSGNRETVNHASRSALPNYGKA
jgi:hypothetical protein